MELFDGRALDQYLPTALLDIVEARMMDRIDVYFGAVPLYREWAARLYGA